MVLLFKVDSKLESQKPKTLIRSVTLNEFTLISSAVLNKFTLIRSARLNKFSFFSCLIQEKDLNLHPSKAKLIWKT